MTQDKTLQIPETWLLGLVEILKIVENSKGTKNEDIANAMLVGYTNSAKIFLKNEN
jgi:hypothetical protein